MRACHTSDRVTPLLWVGVAAWLITAIDAGARVAERTPGFAFDAGLAVLAAAALGAGIARSRSLLVGAAAVYLLYFTLRLYLLEVQPLLAIMAFPDALADASYVMWSSPVGRLSHGQIAGALAEVFRDGFMPLTQAGIVASAFFGRADKVSGTGR